MGTQRAQDFWSAGGDEDSAAAVDHSLEAPQKVNVELPSDPAITLPREVKKCPHTVLYVMFTAALFIRGNRGDNPVSMDRW